MNEIRKISIGPDYKTAMHYIVGNPVIKDSHIVSNIIKQTNGVVFIWVENDLGEKVCWKEISPTVPYSLEFDIDF